MLNAQPVFVLLIGWFVGPCSFGFGSVENDENSNIILPWIGILRVKSGTNHPDAVTGLVMIQKHLAVGNARDVGNVHINILRKYAKAMFNRVNVWWQCGVTDRVLHPEYFVDVKNTLALVYLSCRKEDFYWAPVSWPTINTTLDNVYTIKLTDNDQQLQQVTTRMELVKDSHCNDFYKKEKLDFKSLEPTHRICCKELRLVKQCVIDAGMALAVKSGDSWILIGISILGPGCSLPSRFIQFLPYIPWINSLNTKGPQNSRRSSSEPRTWNVEHSRGPYQTTTTTTKPSGFWQKENMSEPYEDQDTLLLHRINDNTIVMMPELAYLKEEVYGRCEENHGVLMYREYGTIRAPMYTATAVYAISLYDLFFPKITCVMVTVMCNKRSKIRYWVTTGFHQEDIEDFVRIIPMDKNRNAPKIWYLQDTYLKYRTTEIVNVDFKFEFTDEAKMDLEFYGFNISSPLVSLNLPILPKEKQVSGHLPDGADFNARDDEPNDNDSFYHF